MPTPRRRHAAATSYPLRSGRPVTIIASWALTVTALLVMPPAPAHGHAAGPPPQADIRADNDQVVLQWTASPDDAAAVGVAAGLLPAEAVDAYLGAAPTSAVPTAEEIRTLSADPALAAYLLEHVTVTQDDDACAGDVEPASDFVADGATFTFRCPDDVTRADVRITLLHDVDPAYRTFLVDGSIQTAVLTSTSPTATWDFTAAQQPASDRGGTVVAVAVVFVALFVAAAVAFGTRRRRRVARQ